MELKMSASSLDYFFEVVATNNNVPAGLRKLLHLHTHSNALLK